MKALLGGGGGVEGAVNVCFSGLMLHSQFVLVKEYLCITGNYFKGHQANDMGHEDIDQGHRGNGIHRLPCAKYDT